MATIIVHGTVPIQAPHQVKWWWKSWHEDGFLGMLAESMRQQCDGWHDVWHVAGAHVSDIAALQPDGFDWQNPFASVDQLWTYRGHFMWSGSNMHSERVRAGGMLVEYLNRVHRLAPGEKIRVVAHSHGCNAFKVASCSPDLDDGIVFERVVFLGCPHVVVHKRRGAELPYWLNTERVGVVFNFYSEDDSVQTGLATAYPGPPEDIGTVFGRFEALRVDQDADAEDHYLNLEIPTHDSGIQAHSALHGTRVAVLAGLALESDIEEFVERYGEAFDHPEVFPVPLGDHGE